MKGLHFVYRNQYPSSNRTKKRRFSTLEAKGLHFVYRIQHISHLIRYKIAKISGMKLKINAKKGRYLLQSTTKKHKQMLMKKVSYVNSNATDTYPYSGPRRAALVFFCDRKIFNCLVEPPLEASSVCFTE